MQYLLEKYGIKNEKIPNFNTFIGENEYEVVQCYQSAHVNSHKNPAYTLGY